MTEWAIVLDDSFYRAVPSIEAFAVERETPKCLIGKAFSRERQPKENCRRGLTEIQARSIAATAQAVFERAKTERKYWATEARKAANFALTRNV